MPFAFTKNRTGQLSESREEAKAKQLEAQLSKQRKEAPSAIGYRPIGVFFDVTRFDDSLAGAVESHRHLSVYLK